MCSPRSNWGPALEENKTGRYAPRQGINDVKDIYTVKDHEMSENGIYKQPITGFENTGYVKDPNEFATKF
jgi:hypothetical protein